MIPAYRITPQDLQRLEPRTLDALEPLVSKLNKVITPLVAAFNALLLPSTRTASFITADNGAAYVDLGLGAPATDVWLTGLVPIDGTTLDSVYSMSWIALPAGARLLFVGLVPLTTYDFKVHYL